MEIPKIPFDRNVFFTREEVLSVLGKAQSTLRAWRVILDQSRPLGWSYSPTQGAKRGFFYNDLVVLWHFKWLIELLGKQQASKVIVQHMESHSHLLDQDKDRELDGSKVDMIVATATNNSCAECQTFFSPSFEKAEGLIDNRLVKSIKWMLFFQKELPSKPGIYFVFCPRNNTVLYIGKAKDLKSRWVNHHRKDWFTEYAHHSQSNLLLGYFLVQVEDLTITENITIAALSPLLNDSTL